MELKVNKDESGIKIDKLLSERLSIPLSLTAKFIRQKKIKKNNQKVTLQTRVNEGDNITIYSNIENIQNKPTKSNINISIQKLVKFFNKIIIYEDEDMIVINKPTGLSVQGGTRVTKSLDKMFQAIPQYNQVRVVHRLDKDTSGIMLFAKTRESASKICEDFANHKIEKYYIAVIDGIPNNDSGTIDSNIIQDTKSYEALTKYKVLETNHQTNSSLILLQPITGRKHQIRIHCKEHLHPIIGDSKYSKNETMDSLMLCCMQIKLTNNKVFKIDKLPEHFTNFKLDNLSSCIS